MTIHALLRPMFLTILLAAAGCAGSGQRVAPTALESRLAAAPRTVALVDGRDGAALTWDDLLHRAERHDVVIIGEQHNDGVGHAVEAAFVRDFLARRPGSAICLEMLERDDQPLVDDHLEGLIDATTFAKLTHSTNWGGKGRWADWYQPIVDAVAESDGTLVAANAPRRYVRVARLDGYERLDEMPSERRALFDCPEVILEGDYQDRFRELMSATDDPSHGGDMVDALYRAQLVWDTTMANSVARALDEDADHAVLIVGQFHSDFEGGTVQQLRALDPGLRILVVSMIPSENTTLDEEDRDRADVIAYTRSGGR